VALEVAVLVPWRFCFLLKFFRRVLVLVLVACLRSVLEISNF
jgi:hypothetical protein